jgi:hypothetical protein
MLRDTVQLNGLPPQSALSANELLMMKRTSFGVVGLPVLTFTRLVALVY